MRSDNAIDFWRGVALVMIFINHIPGNFLSFYTLRNFAISDAAELFVFLAGWSLSFIAGRPDKPAPVRIVVSRLLLRAFDLYRAQLFITVLALALLAATAIARNNPIYLEWHNAGTAFYDPTRGVIGLALLTYQLGYFNILPLYVVLMLLAPALLLLARWSKAAALAASLALYAYALSTRTSLPSWPSEDQWFFNPLGWQLLLAIGFLSATLARESETFPHLVARLVPLAAAGVVAGMLVTLNQIWPDPMTVPSPRLFFLFDKTYLSPVRILSVVALVVAFHGVYARLPAALGPVAAFFCKLGRNSLGVFSVGSLLALVGQIVRFVEGGSMLADALMVACGLVVMGGTAWFLEWGQR